MSSKLTFRARTLDASKSLAVHFSEELPELSDLNAISRSVPVMPSGMEKEEEAEKHLQDVLDIKEHKRRKHINKAAKETNKEDNEEMEAVIPTPETFECAQVYQNMFKKAGPFRLPRAYIHVQPFNVDHDLPDYDMDSEDEKFLNTVLKAEKKFEVDEVTFEDMIDRLEKNSGHSVVSAKEAKLLLKEDDDLILAVYDYWIDKRLRLKQPLHPIVKTEKASSRGDGVVASGSSGALAGTITSGTAATSIGQGGMSNSNAQSSSAVTNPYIAFRRRTEKMQTRKNRKNDEVSYERMLKLRRDLSKAVTLLEMVKRREKTKKEHLNLMADIFERRYRVNDFEGKLYTELTSTLAKQKSVTSSTKISHSSSVLESDYVQRRHHVKHHKKHQRHRKNTNSNQQLFQSIFPTSSGSGSDGTAGLGGVSSDDDHNDNNESNNEEVNNRFAFRRKKNVQYLAPLDYEQEIEATDKWIDAFDRESGSYFCMGSLSCGRSLGLIRRRIGRGGRVVLDRLSSNLDSSIVQQWPSLYRPLTPPNCRDDDDDEPPRKQGPGVAPTNSLLGRRFGGVLKAVNVDAVRAHNSATAVVTSDMLNIFSTKSN